MVPLRTAQAAYASLTCVDSMCGFALGRALAVVRDLLVFGLGARDSSMSKLRLSIQSGRSRRPSWLNV
jgi:hypothetical protein